MISYVYFLLDGDEIVYVGNSKHLHSRVKTHLTNKSFDAVKYIVTDPFFGAKIERLLIAYFKPKYNLRIDWKDFEVKELDITALKKVSKYKEELV
jgi:excinuclease UvrABC nuclease subunit